MCTDLRSDSAFTWKWQFADCNPDLTYDYVLTRPVKYLEMQMLLDPVEELMKSFA